MVKYKIKFKKMDSDYSITRSVKTKAEMSNISFHFQENNIDYEAQEYSKENGRFGWRKFEPSHFCRKCGRSLSALKSVLNGIGPICIKKSGTTEIRNREFPESDLRTKLLTGSAYDKIWDEIGRMSKCGFCSGEFNANIYYYEHDSGWYVKDLDKKVWIWVECSKCGHQWSLEHLHIWRNTQF
ncbi:MAG: DUF6011 domain-containing protein [Candidatus Thorarchaeota archaeon]